MALELARELQNWLVPWLPVAVTLAGWWVVNRQNNLRERRKEERATVDAAKRLIVQTYELAMADLMADERDPLREIQVKALVEQVEVELLRLDGYSVGDRSQLTTFMASFADACTGGQFESTERLPSRDRLPAATLMLLHRNRLMAALEAWFGGRYPR